MYWHMKFHMKCFAHPKFSISNCWCSKSKLTQSFFLRNWLYRMCVSVSSIHTIDHISSIVHGWEDLMGYHQMNVSDNLKSICGQSRNEKKNENSVNERLTKWCINMCVWPDRQSEFHSFSIFLWVSVNRGKIYYYSTTKDTSNTLSQMQTRWNEWKTNWKRSEQH